MGSFWGKNLMLRVIMVLPGATDLDSQRRIKGSLDIPMNDIGNQQARQTASELDHETIDVVFCSPCLSAQQTAEQLSRDGQIKIKGFDEMRNLDRGLWHGKLIDELKDAQPKVYRQWQEAPETVCPPGGETLDDARKRLSKVTKKIRKKQGTVVVVAPEPIASLLRSELDRGEIGDLWQAECRCGEWQEVQVGIEA